MSLPIPGSEGTRCLITGSARIRGASVTNAGFTSARPRTSAPRSAARRAASAPPIDSPPTTTARQREVSSSSERSAASYQSAQVVVFISCQVVPCPGSSGSRTLSPSSASRRAHGCRLCGVPVKPWHSSTPTSPPSWANGSAPGRTGTDPPWTAPDGAGRDHRSTRDPAGRGVPYSSSTRRREGCTVFYWLLKTVVLGPVLKLVFRPWVTGLEHVPASGGAILASNHLSFSDSIFLPLVVERKVTFL